LIIASLQKPQQLGWLPAVLLPGASSGKTTFLDPGHAEAYPAVYTTASAKNFADPAFAGDADVKKFVSDMKEYASDVTTNTGFLQCAWGYSIGATLEATFKQMKAPTRAAFMEAARSLKNLELPMLLPGVTVDTTSPTRAPVDSAKVQKFSFEKGVYVDADAFCGDVTW
jgi:hypothetical protein